MIKTKEVTTFQCDTEVSADSLIEAMRNKESDGEFNLKKYTKERKEIKITKSNPEGGEYWVCTFYKEFI